VNVSDNSDAVNSNRPQTKKRAILIDAVAWSEAYPASSPHRDVGRWFSRWLTDVPAFELSVVGVDADHRKLLDDVGGVIISGSPRDAWREDPVNDRLLEVIDSCRERRLPLLGVCYGHQLLGRALGAKVAPQPQGFELGNVELTLTRAGLDSPLFRGLSQRFQVLQSHGDAVQEMPAQCELLATGGLTPIQSFHYDDLLMGVQFHPEQEPESLRFIWSVRRDKWRDKVDFDLDARLDNLQPTPLAARVLQNFVNHYVL